MLNEHLTQEEAINQLNLANEEITELQLKIQKMQRLFDKYKKQERKITFNVELLYYQIKFLLDAEEKFGQIVTHDDKITLIKSFYE